MSAIRRRAGSGPPAGPAPSTGQESEPSYWDRYAERHLGETGRNVNRAEWLGHPVVQRRFQELLGGVSAAEWLGQRYLQPAVDRGLGIGAGAAPFELSLLDQGSVRHYDLLDNSATSLTAARAAARERGLTERVTLRVTDVNTESFERNAYDLITFKSSLHHVHELDHVVRSAYEALRPGGILFADEYVGPNRFAFPEADMEFSRRLYRVLDEALTSGWPELLLPDPDEVARADPTEAVHSQEIVSVLTEVFDDVHSVNVGGCITSTIWYGLNHDALYESQRGHDLVELIWSLDRTMLEAAKLPPYFAYLVAQRKPDASRA